MQPGERDYSTLICCCYLLFSGHYEQPQEALDFLVKERHLSIPLGIENAVEKLRVCWEAERVREVRGGVVSLTAPEPVGAGEILMCLCVCVCVLLSGAAVYAAELAADLAPVFS